MYRHEVKVIDTWGSTIYRAHYSDAWEAYDDWKRLVEKYESKPTQGWITVVRYYDGHCMNSRVIHKATA